MKEIEELLTAAEAQVAEARNKLNELAADSPLVTRCSELSKSIEDGRRKLYQWLVRVAQALEIPSSGLVVPGVRGGNGVSYWDSRLDTACDRYDRPWGEHPGYPQAHLFWEFCRTLYERIKEVQATKGERLASFSQEIAAWCSTLERA